MFDSTKHFTPAYRNWDESEALEAIREIARDAISAVDPVNLWPTHPQEDGLSGGLGCIYFGAAGIIWALDHLKRRGLIGATPDLVGLLQTAVGNNQAWYEKTPYPEHASFLIGDIGIFLVQMRVAPTQDLADKIYNLAKTNNLLPVRELMWGLPGAMLACLHMHGLTKDHRFKALFEAQTELLFADLETDGITPIWTQDLYGSKRKFLGPVHGFAGNMVPLLGGWDWLTPDQRAIITHAVLSTLENYAISSKLGTAWPALIPVTDPTKPLLCQHCHGAPGMVTTFATAPISTAKFETLLRGGAELTWNAGPLMKGSNLCHGTSGNGYAFLKMFRRTGDPLWLNRARSFGMIAIDQFREARVEYGQGRYSLWTGDIGLAIFLDQCIEGTSYFPTIDVL